MEYHLRSRTTKIFFLQKSHDQILLEFIGVLFDVVEKVHNYDAIILIAMTLNAAANACMGAELLRTVISV